MLAQVTHQTSNTYTDPDTFAHTYTCSLVRTHMDTRPHVVQRVANLALVPNESVNTALRRPCQVVHWRAFAVHRSWFVRMLDSEARCFAYCI